MYTVEKRIIMVLGSPISSTLQQYVYLKNYEKGKKDMTRSLQIFRQSTKSACYAFSLNRITATDRGR